MRWAEADLVARLLHALKIAKRALELFAIDGYADAELPENSFRPEKAVAETAMLIYAASAVRHIPAVGERLDELAQLLLPHARSRRTLLNIALHPSICLDFAVPHVLLTKLGYSDPGFDEVIKTCMRSRVSEGHERPPFAAVEQKWITSLIEDNGPSSNWRPYLRNSVLNRPLDILGGPREDAYAFTHLMMYCTDFGFRAPFLPRPRTVTLAQARSLLAKCLDDEDYDLAGEILLAWPLSGAPWSPLTTFVFHVLASVEDRVGVLPGGTTSSDRLKRLDGEERTQYTFGTAYHTAYVMGMICAASLRPGRAPSARIAGREANPQLVDCLLDFTGTDQGHWQPAFAELSHRQQAALLPFLLDVAIVQNCRKRDYQNVASLLTIAYENNLSDSVLCGQAAELLERLSVCTNVLLADTAVPAG